MKDALPYLLLFLFSMTPWLGLWAIYYCMKRTVYGRHTKR